MEKSGGFRRVCPADYGIKQILIRQPLTWSNNSGLVKKSRLAQVLHDGSRSGANGGPQALETR
jgi:hypothetical protein